MNVLMKRKPYDGCWCLQSLMLTLKKRLSKLPVVVVAVAVADGDADDEQHVAVVVVVVVVAAAAAAVAGEVDDDGYGEDEGDVVEQEAEAVADAYDGMPTAAHPTGFVPSFAWAYKDEVRI